MSKSKNTITAQPSQELLTEQNLSTIEEKLVKGMTLTEIIEDKQYPFSLMKFYHYLKKNPELEQRILEARKIGIQTLIDKLMQIFNLQEVENPNQILWIREKTKFILWIASKITDLYSDNKPQQVKTDQNITISFESGFNDKEIIDLEGNFEMSPELPSNKD